jgi:hypothetical protein
VDLSDQDVRELLQCCYNPPPASGSAYKTINPATVEDQFALLAMFVLIGKIHPDWFNVGRFSETTHVGEKIDFSISSASYEG